MSESVGTARRPDAKKILILGSGFGSVYTLRWILKLTNANHNIEVTILSDENLFTFSPLLHEVATGAIEPRHVALPIRKIPGVERIRFVQTSVMDIDLVGKKVTADAGSFNFDYLILALGSVRDFSGLEVKGDNLFTLKTLTDARQIKNHIIQVFEKASLEESPQRQKELLTFVVSGGGYIGVQLIAALRDFIYRDLVKSYRTVDPANIRLILAEIKPKIISPLHTKLGAYIMNYLRKTGIDVRLKSRVTEIDSNHVVINGKENVPTNTLIWVAGLLSNPQIARMDARKDDIGRVLVNEKLQLLDFPDVFALGDCAHFADASGQPIPPKAHTAVRQAKVAVINILANIEGRKERRYVYSNPFEVIPLGRTNGVFSFHSLRFYGPIARLLWMVGYAILFPNMYNRIRISTDWLLSMIFGRDLNYLK